MSKTGWVYILANRYRGTIYIGVTSSLAHRISQHRAGTGAQFSSRYGCKHLVLVEPFERIEDAIAREKQLKHWNRAWKIRLIEAQNPEWRDRFDEIVWL
jgi:putative endonuclease